jgi:4,5-dihydroxyphthalate decarboxylase
MSRVKVVTMNHSRVQPLRLQRMQREGLDIELDTEMSLQQAWHDESVDAVEIGLLNYIRLIAGNDDEGLGGLVGVPLFLRRAFGHRHIYVLQSSELRELGALRRCRIGTNMWLGSGNFWTRDAIRDAGVDTGEIDWIVGPLREGDGVPEEPVPDYVEQRLDPGFDLITALESGEIDALIYPAAPAEVFDSNSIRHLLEHYRDVECDYFRRTGIFPAQHILAIRRDYLSKRPEVCSKLFRAFADACRHSEQAQLFMADASPWILEDLERTVQLMGADWQKDGLAGNETMLTRFSEGLAREGLAPTAPNPDVLFAEYERSTAAHA